MNIPDNVLLEVTKLAFPLPFTLKTIFRSGKYIDVIFDGPFGLRGRTATYCLTIERNMDVIISYHREDESGCRYTANQRLIQEILTPYVDKPEN